MQSIHIFHNNLLFLLKSLDHDRLSSNDFFMVTVILDFTDGRVKILHHPPMQMEELEIFMYEKYGLSESNIDWMTVEKLQIETLD